MSTETRKITLTKGKETLVDAEDYERLNRSKWHSHKIGNYYYAARRTYPERKLLLMHREILHPFNNVVIDHINHDSLDNRKQNLRSCSIAENVRNQPKSSRPSSSEFKGVYWDKKRRRWTAQIFKSRNFTIGRFHSEVEAARAYDARARELFGEFASTNFGKGD